MSSISVRIPEALRRELQRLSRRQKRPLSEIVREALEKRVAGERQQLERDPRFRRRIAKARQSLREGKGVRIEDVEE